MADRLGSRADAQTLGALQRVTDAALAYLSEEELLTELLLRISEILDTDTAAILLLDESGEMLQARAAKGIEEEVERGLRIPVGKGFAGRIAAQRSPIVVGDVDHADVLNPLLREKGIRSLLGVPLLAENQVLGVLHVGSLTPRTFSDEERDVLQLAADRAALAIQHAELYERERQARAAAEAASRRLEALSRVTDATLAYLSEDELLTELLLRITEILGTDTAAILLLDESGDVLHARAAKGIEEEVEQGVQIPVGKGFAGRVAAERRPLFIPDVDHADIINPLLREKGIRSLLGVPLLAENQALGVLHVGSLTPRTFTAEERDLLQLAADRAAIAIQQASLYEQRRLAEALQRRLLPSHLRHIPGLELAGRYLPASGETLGGDWYDAFSLTGGRVAVVVGDVVGHGLLAAAVMAQLRTALHAYAADGYPPATVVDRVNSLLWEIGPTAMTTLAYLVIDPEAQSLELVNAGHPPPLVIDTDGETRFLPIQGSVPLGVSPAARYRSATHRFPTGAALVLYTDGLVERRGESIDAGLARLRALGSGETDMEKLCTRLVEGLVPGERADDVAVITARVPPLPDALSGTWPAEARALSQMRHLLRRWLRERGASDDETYDITVACQEACANAVEHAYGPGRETFDVEASATGARVRIVVRDRGRWRPARGANRGRGLQMMRRLMESVDVRHGDDGTEVVMERTLAGKAA